MHIEQAHAQLMTILTQHISEDFLWSELVGPVCRDKKRFQCCLETRFD